MDGVAVRRSLTLVGVGVDGVAVRRNPIRVVAPVAQATVQLIGPGETGEMGKTGEMGEMGDAGTGARM